MKRWLILFTFAVAFSACKSAADSYDVPSGAIAGRVRVHDSDGVVLANEYGNVSIVLEGTSLRATPDSLGYYTFSNVRPGSYSVLLTKPGYGRMRCFTGAVTGPAIDQLGPAELFEEPTAAAFVDSVLPDTRGYLHVYGHTAGKDLIFFLDRSPNEAPYDNHDYVLVGGLRGQASGAILYDALEFRSGSTAYISAAATNCAAYASRDSLDKRSLPVSCGPKSNVVAVVIP